MFSLRLCFFLAVVFMLLLALVSHSSALFGRWPDLNMTYTIDQSCAAEERNDAIMQGIVKWRQWLPEATWTQLGQNASSARVIFYCLDGATVPEAPLTAVSTAFSAPDGHTFLFFMVRIATGAWAGGMAQPADTVAHELGHVLGLAEHNGGLMSDISLPPTQEQLDEIRVAYGLVQVHKNPTVTVSTDRGSYRPGESVTIQIQVAMTENPTNMTWLWLYIDKPDGHNALFMQLDPVNQTIVWNIPVNATQGAYTVTVMWSHRYAETGFTVEGQPIPEFPFAPLVLMVATAIAFLAVSWRKASARSETLAPRPRACLLCRGVRGSGSAPAKQAA